MINPLETYALSRCSGPSQSWDNCAITRFIHKDGNVVEEKVIFENGKAVKPASAKNRLENKSSAKLRKAFYSFTLAERKSIQTRLKQLGKYNASIDGIYGMNTDAAFKAYQKPLLSLDEEQIIQEMGNLIASTPKNLKSSSIEAINPSFTISEPVAKTDSDKPEADTILDHKQLINSENVVDAFLSGDYQTALFGAKILVPQNEKIAPYVLGAMYAEGLGVLQHYKTAHMWLNIAALRGSDEAIDLRNNVQERMSPGDIAIAQDMAMLCITSRFSDCAGMNYNTSKPSTNNMVSAPISKDITSAFNNQDLLRRKQIQYALRELGLYNTQIDGLWGSGTRKALLSYARVADRSFSDADDLFIEILSKVDTPTVFSTSRKKKVDAPTAAQNNIKNNSPKYRNSLGYVSFGNTSMPTDQALAICKPISENAFDQAYAGSGNNGLSGINCNSFGNYTNCKPSYNGGAAVSFMNGFAKGLAGKMARDNALKSCMAQYGWKKSK